MCRDRNKTDFSAKLLNVSGILTKKASEFYAIVAHFLDLLQQLGKVGLQGRLAAGDAHAVQDADALAQEIQKGLHGNGIVLSCAQEATVVAEGAAEITAL